MTFNKADIIARLQKGEKIEDIANEMSEILNTAEADYKAEQVAKELESKRVEDAKDEACQRILEGFADFCAAAGEEELVADIKKTDASEIRGMLDQGIELVKALTALSEFEFKVPTEKKVAAGADTAIANFLRDFGL